MTYPYESLHNHTNISDGVQTHHELLATAEQNGFGVIAFTDHDTLPNDTILRELQAYSGPVKWYLGCEISSGWPKEMGGGAASMFHIVGLFVDPHNVALRQHCQTAVSARLERMKAIVANLRSLGLTISVDDCLEASGGESVGRPHIVKAIYTHPENEAVIEEMRQQMAKAAQSDATINEKYQQMLLDEPEKHPYSLFLSNDSFIPGVYVDYQYWRDMDQSVRLIRDAGGVAIIAHWPTVKKKLSLAQISEFIKQGRLDGIEIASGFVGTGFSDDERAMQQLAIDLGCLQTIGIDTHKPEHFGEFLRLKPEAAQMSIGQTERLLAQLKRKS